MFTNKAKAIIEIAKEYALEGGTKAELGLSHMLRAVCFDTEASVLLADCVGLSREKLLQACPELSKPETRVPESLPLSVAVREVVACAGELAEEVPNRSHPGLIDLCHLASAMAMSIDVCTTLNTTPLSRRDGVAFLTAWYVRLECEPEISELVQLVRSTRSRLQSRVFGQDDAVHTFAEGLFNAEVIAAADKNRKAPRAVFVFVGPPGVGKTYLAELGAECLGRPFKRFDMSSFSGHFQNEQLIGSATVYRGSQPGQLTEFVRSNPNAVLLFDEIEKAHVNTIQLLLQVLDGGHLEDKYRQETVAFKDTIVIFTTNAGRKLYDTPNTSGVLSGGSTFHRKTVLDALKGEENEKTGDLFFPPEICSRLSTGYPVLFKYLRINELERVAQTGLGRAATLFELQYYKPISFDPVLPMCLVLKEGYQADARTLRSQSEIFVKSEILKFCQLFEADRLEEIMEQAQSIRFALDEDFDSVDADVKALFEASERPRVLLAADRDIADLYREYVPEVSWQAAHTSEDALEILANEDVDIVLLDLWIEQPAADSAKMTPMQFDHIPAAAQSLRNGQKILRKVRDRLPNMPVFLLSLADTDEEGDGRGSVDDELLAACIRGGGARGVVVSSFVDGMVKGWEAQRDEFAVQVVEICRRLYQEKAANRLANERKVLSFDTVPCLDSMAHADKGSQEILIRLRNLRITRAIAAADTGEVLDDVQRPSTRFDDVIGAEAAKEELMFFVDYLKNPKRFAALGLKPPKGVLLHGPPGTGKTMLARAMAGESNLAFLPVVATNFVTVWIGSGPQNVRNLFARARRYAPSIVFIDELDAIGKIRSGTIGAGRAEENTLNALFAELDGFTSSSPERPVFVLAATNFDVRTDESGSLGWASRALDPALVRRFSRTILVDLPERVSREQYLLKRFSGRRSCSVDIETIKMIAERSAGMSIADLEMIIETAARNAIVADSELTDKVFEEAFETTQFGDARARNQEEIQRTARHEAGHALMYWLSGRWPAYVTVVARGNYGGYMAPCANDKDNRGVRTREQLLFDIRVDLAGRAAELLYYGPEQGLSTGVSADLQRATNLARDIVCRYGMEEDFGLLVTPELFKYEAALSSPVYLKLNDAVGKILGVQMAETQKSLEQYRHHLDALAEALVRHERLTTENLRQILPPLTNSAG